MKTLNWRKVSRFYIWIILLVLAVIIFILLKSPAAGQRQASQDLSEPGISALSVLEDETQVPNQPSTSGYPVMPVPPPDDDNNLKALPEAIPDPWPYPKPPLCPMLNQEVSSYDWRCLPCRNYLDVPLSASDIVCVEL
ncbi:hypothetical protein HYS85_00650 [Candidatus Saccharibacteria bacterium]|nr:hypothetical protein [Candidatus Saccharibacteria bacterium]